MEEFIILRVLLDYVAKHIAESPVLQNFPAAIFRSNLLRGYVARIYFLIFLYQNNI